jgi:putative Mg2+ transporter-C (MgtC) family protein
MNMPLEPSRSEIALTMLAGAVIGFNRGAQGQAAGFRTTILVGWRRQPPRARPTFCCR